MIHSVTVACSTTTRGGDSRQPRGEF